MMNKELRKFMRDFESGISDALLLGKSAEVNLTDGYKRGFVFGIYLEKKMSDQEQKYADNGIGGFSE
jgi:hypothetical protein|tara:strand:+ start:325 stop:525 length:201 start_codon:yes stop_codon:yes gene_type:complete